MNYLKKYRNYSLLNLAFTFILLFFILFKSFVVQISYDEAFSFLQYTYTKNFFNIGLANNHLLNTLLIYPFSLIDLSEFSLRLPNILSGVLYIFICIKFLIKCFPKHSTCSSHVYFQNFSIIRLKLN